MWSMCEFIFQRHTGTFTQERQNRIHVNIVRNRLTMLKICWDTCVFIPRRKTIFLWALWEIIQWFFTFSETQAWTCRRKTIFMWKLFFLEVILWSVNPSETQAYSYRGETIYSQLCLSRIIAYSRRYIQDPLLFTIQWNLFITRSLGPLKITLLYQVSHYIRP